MGITIQRKVYEVLDTGLYAAVVADIEAADGQYGPQLKWTFVLLDFEDEHKVLAWSSQALTAKSKLGLWAEAILGELPEELDTDDLINRKCQLELVIQQGKDGAEFNRVNSVRPWRQRAAARPAQAPRPTPTAKSAPPADPDPQWDSILRDEAAATSKTASVI